MAGLRLGMQLAEATAAVGGPARVDTIRVADEIGFAITNEQRGLSMVAQTTLGVRVVYTVSRATGNLDGLRVGDSRSAVLARWGPPTTVQERSAFWVVDDWVVMLTLDENDIVSQLGIGYVAR